MFAHLGAGKENVRSTTRARARKTAEKKKAAIDDERDENLQDPEFEADKHLVMIETELIDRTKTEMLHNQIKDRFVPSLDKVCEELGEEFHPDNFDEA